MINSVSVTTLLLNNAYLSGILHLWNNYAGCVKEIERIDFKTNLVIPNTLSGNNQTLRCFKLVNFSRSVQYSMICSVHVGPFM